VRLGGAKGTESGEKMIVWRQDGRSCRRGFIQSSQERRFDAGFAANLPAEDGEAAWSGPARRSSPERSPNALTPELLTPPPTLWP
jgi:hypothetical protein